eukprot:3271103-Amphidinium_carterae.1
MSLGFPTSASAAGAALFRPEAFAAANLAEGCAAPEEDAPWLLDAAAVDAAAAEFPPPSPRSGIEMKIF